MTQSQPENLRPMAVYTHHEIRVRLNGKPTPMRFPEDTPRLAKEVALEKCKALGLSEYRELAAHESIDDPALPDGVYVCEVKVEVWPQQFG